MNRILNLYHHLPAFARTMAASLRGYYLSYMRYGSDTNKFIEEAQEREKWSAASWETWQQEKIFAILERAANHVPYYRDQWILRRKNGDKASYSYLENWPVLPKEELRNYPLCFLTDDSTIKKMYKDNTSGSTGTPIYTYLSKGTLHKWYALFEARIRMWHGVSRHDRWAILGGQLVVPFTKQTPPYWVYNAGLNQLYLSTHHISHTTAKSYIEKLKEFRPSHMIVYPSSAAVLAKEILDQNLLPPKLEVIFSNAELLTPDQRELIGQAFSCPVINTYGMGEYLTGASECKEGTMHYWPEVGYVEVQNDFRDSPEHDQCGRLIITSLLNEDMPLIRYDTGDRGKINNNTSCGCGRTLPTIDSLEGRSNDLLYTKDGRKIFWINPVFYGLPIQEAQVIQESIESITVLFVPAPGYDHNDVITSRLIDRLGDMEIILRPVEKIPREPNGKFKAVISKVHLD